jgi:hypothetical protein
MRVIIAAIAAAAVVAACQPDSEKTNPAVATDEAKAEREETAPAAGANSFTEAQARDHATRAGYMEVGALTQAADGTWQGSAMKDGASVMVVVDYQGNVTSKALDATQSSDAAPAPGATPTPDTTH